MNLVLALAAVLFAVPAYTAPVVDEADRVPAEVERAVSAALIDYERRSGNEIAVAVVRTTDDLSIEDYANDLLREHWKPGSAGRDNGVIYVIALDDRRVRIEVGNDLQGDLTDLETGRIINDRLIPLLRAGDIGAAVDQGTQAVRQALGDTQVGALPPVPEPADDGADGRSPWGLLPAALIAFAVFGMRRGRRGWGGGVPIIWGGGFGGGGGGGGGGWSGGGGGGGASGGGASGGW